MQNQEYKLSLINTIFTTDIFITNTVQQIENAHKGHNSVVDHTINTIIHKIQFTNQEIQ